jgi:DNA segregation ATPase FtsK/SpoIIIE, S-DNA-T family
MAKTPTQEKTPTARHPEIKGLLLLSCALVMMISLLSFSISNSATNWLGLVGHFLAWLLNFLFGLTSYLLAGYLGWLGWKLVCNQKVPTLTSKTIYFSIFVVSCCFILNLLAEKGFPLPEAIKNKIYSESAIFNLPYPHRSLRYYLGGMPFYYLYSDLPTFNLQRLLSDVGIGITFSLSALVSFLLFTEIQMVPLVLSIKNYFSAHPISLKKVASFFSFPAESKPSQQHLDQVEKTLTNAIPPPVYSPKAGDVRIHTLSDPPLKEEIQKKIKLPAKEKAPTKKEAAIAAQKVYNGDYTAYQIPPPSLLSNPKKVDQPSLKKDLRKQAEILEETLLSFGIEAKVGEINCGPTITSFEVHPSVGVKVQKITALENDIALNLQAKSIRIIAPIPGKAAVGVEIPSLYPQEVSFKEMLIQYQQSPRKMHIPVILGKTVAGDNVFSDLTKMPHCIIAGATGSGKSVCINTLIMSILMTARPDEIKLLMIDPKKVELTPYTALPHMIAPVITEPHGAYAALHWLVKEMTIRYDILKQLGVRNITAFNNRQINKEFESSLNIQIPERMYGIVAIIDEFADLMMVSSTDLETPIARIAQMARAVGIHLVLATQRPSREVITGLIKANFPTRIAFKVASRINSQIILDESGADSLLGNGDMLYLPPGSSHLVRAQGAYIKDEDINRVVSFITDQAPPNYLISSFDTMKKEDLGVEETASEGSSRDSLYDQALRIVLDTQTASTTFLQRKLKIGYARAASLMDELESKGIIGPQEGSKPRRILSAQSEDKKKPSFEMEEEFE